MEEIGISIAKEATSRQVSRFCVILCFDLKERPNIKTQGGRSGRLQDVCGLESIWAAGKRRFVHQVQGKWLAFKTFISLSLSCHFKYEMELPGLNVALGNLCLHSKHLNRAAIKLCKF